MKYVNWIVGVLLIAVGVVALARPVWAGWSAARSVRGGWSAGPPYGWCHRGQFGLALLAHHLDLTDAQQTQIKTIWKSERPTVLPLIRQLADGHKQMAAATANGNFDEGRVRLIADQQAQTVAQLLVEKEKLTSKIYSKVLTPEQRTKADHMRAQMNNRIDQFLDSLERGSD